MTMKRALRFEDRQLEALREKEQDVIPKSRL